MAIKSVATKTVAGKTKVLATQKAAPQKDGEAAGKGRPRNAGRTAAVARSL